MEVNAEEDLDGDDRRGNPIDDEAERRPSTRVRDELSAMLPEVLEPMARETSKNADLVTGRGSHNNEGSCDADLNRDHRRAAISHRETNVDGGDQHQAKRVDRRGVKPLERERRRRLHHSEPDPPQPWCPH